MLIFEIGKQGRRAGNQAPVLSTTEFEQALQDIPAKFHRKKAPGLPEVSEFQVVRHYTRLSRHNFSIDTHFYPLGSCTMKYNPRGAHRAAMIPGIANRHPLADENHSQGILACLHDLQLQLASLTGMQGCSLAPMAGAQGELAGVSMIRAYHEARGDDARCEILIPTAAHGTNPATAIMCGYKVREIPVLDNGDVDLASLKAALGPQTAGIMMTNPSTCGVFERQVAEIASSVHDAGGLLYYDGANLNAIMGKVKPGDMGFDVLHFNLHKTFATPHGGGGPGAGPVAVGERLLPYMPSPTVIKEGERYRWSTEKDLPHSIGPMSAFMGNAGVLLRAYYYGKVLGGDGLQNASEMAALNANYLMKRLEALGFDLAYPERRATHEFIITFKRQVKELGVNAMDFAKRLLDYGFHAPTTYFPLLVPECWLIEPTETETLDEMDLFIDALEKILQEAKETPELLKTAPHTLSWKRLDDVKAARDLDVAYKG